MAEENVERTLYPMYKLAPIPRINNYHNSEKYVLNISYVLISIYNVVHPECLSVWMSNQNS